MLKIGRILGVLIMAGGMYGCADLKEPHVIAPKEEPVPKNLIAKLQPKPSVMVNRPMDDAAQAVSVGDYRFIHLDYKWHKTVPGVSCVLYPAHARGVKFSISIDEKETPETIAFREKAENYARAYNRHILNASNYPDYDICHQADVGWLNGKPSLNELVEFFDWKGQPGRRSEWTDLNRAVRFGHVDQAVRQLKDEKLGPQRDGWGMAPLDWAVARGQSDLTRLLLARQEISPLSPLKRDDQGQYDWSGGTPLQTAMRWAILSKRQDQLTLVLERAALAFQGCNLGAFVAPGIVLATEEHQSAAVKILLPSNLDISACPPVKDAVAEAISIAQANNDVALESWLIGR